MKRLLAIIPIALLAGCGESIESVEEQGASGAQNGALCSNTAIKPYRRALLNLAYDGVSKMPLSPHIKNRSRAQMKVVDACLELGQAGTAETYIEDIANWRHWMGYADLAFYCAQTGDAATASQLLKKVEPALQAADDRNKGRVVGATPNERLDTLMDWRYEQVLTRVAEVQLLLQDDYALNATEEVYGEVNGAMLRAKLAFRDQSAEETLKTLQAFTVDPNFEVIHLGLSHLVDYIDVQYATIVPQAFIQREIFPAMDNMPVYKRIDIFERLTTCAVNHADAETTAFLLDQMARQVASLEGQPQFHIPEAVKLIRLRFEAGQQAEALQELNQLYADYVVERDRIVDIYRAALLCRMAEIYAQMDQPERALELYSTAVEEGQVNPNARPQADDLNEICCSMARVGVEPSEELMSRLETMKNDLGAPW